MNRLHSAVAALVCAVTGCALGPGDAFGTATAQLQVHFDPSEREAADGWYRLSSDYELRLDSATLTAGAVELIAVTGGGAGGTFDPANPPPGYSLCHGGHCHSADGRLVPYEEIQAELGGGASSSTLVTFAPPTAGIDVLAGSGVVPLTCPESCELPATTLRRIRLPLNQLSVSGRVRDTREPSRLPGELAFAFSLPEEDTPLTTEASVSVPIDRTEAPQVHFALELRLSPTFFDEVPWNALTQEDDGTLNLASEANHEVLDELLAGIAGSSLSAQLTRTHR